MSCENHVHGATAAPEATLALWKDVVFTDMLGESMKNDIRNRFTALLTQASILLMHARTHACAQRVQNVLV